MTINRKSPLLTLLGPTASGKTDLALALSDRLPLSLISVDSALIYRNMDIGTGKPSREILEQYPHALINLRDPNESYSAADFVRDARASISSAHQEGKIPCLVGGTMMYYKALLFGLSDLPAADPELRLRLQNHLVDQGVTELHARLHAVDPVSAARIHPNDAQRIMRALEVFEATGIPLSEHYCGTEGIYEEYDILNLGLMCEDRSVLHQRIADRFDRMLTLGLVQEVQSLRERYALSADLPSMRSVGYRQAWAYLEGHISQAELRAQGIAATRQLAKRQFTWLKSWPNLQSLPMGADTLTEMALDRLSQWGRI